MYEALTDRLRCPGIRECPFGAGEARCSACRRTVQTEAAEAVARLEAALAKAMAERDKAMAERDRAVAALKASDLECRHCAHNVPVDGCDLECGRCEKGCVCASCRENSLWQWDGGGAQP